MKPKKQEGEEKEVIFKSDEEIEALRKKVDSDDIEGEFIVYYKANPTTNQYEIINVESMSGTDIWHYYGDSELFLIKESHKIVVDYIMKNYNENPSQVCSVDTKCENCHSNLNENGFAEKLSVTIREKEEEPLTFEIICVFEFDTDDEYLSRETMLCNSCREHLSYDTKKELQFETLHTKMNKQECFDCGKIIDFDEWSWGGCLCSACSKIETLCDCDDWEWFESYPEEEQSYRLVSIVVFNDPYLIRYVREDLIDETLCLQAVRSNHRVMCRIPERFKTEDFFMKALKQNPWAITSIENPTAEMMMYAYEKDKRLVEYLNF